MFGKLVPVPSGAVIPERDIGKRPILNCINLGVTFGGLKAVDDFNLMIGRTEIAGLIGPNGAGKTTVFNLLTKVYQPTHGTILLDGQDTHNMTTAQVNRAGIARTFQNIRLFNDLTVEENVTVAMDAQMKYNMVSGIFRLPSFWKEEKVAHERALELLSLFHMEDLANVKAGSLPYGAQRRLEIVRALASGPLLLLLDEPFSALDSYLKWNLEIELADLLATFNGPILWVSHDRDECYRNCRSVCVMEDGRTGEVTPMDEMIRHPGSVSAARLAGCKNFFAAEARDGKVYLPEWNVALPLAGMENTFTTIGIPDNAVTMSENGAMSCTVCRVILGVEENILLLRPEGSAEGAPMLRITVGHESDLQAGAAVRVALDYSKLLLL